MKVLKNVCYIISILFIVWFMVSWFDVIMDNSFPSPVHYSWNFFDVITGGLK